LAANYSQLENILLRMAEIDAATNPKRSALLKKVLAESKERLMNMRFSEIIDILEKQRLTDAINEQTELTLDLKDLLRLLESENRAQRRDEEKERIAKLLKEINDLIHREKSLKGRTQQAEQMSPLEPEQRNIHDATDRLSDEMAETQVGPRSKPSDSKSNENKSGDEKSDENKSDENKPNEQKSEQQKPNDNGNRDEHEEQVEADASQSPAQQAMQRSMQRMRRAQKRMEESKKKDAIDEQEEAIAELQKAKAELDKILRQLREEELMQTLQWLDARIKKMLATEKLILTQTQKTAAEQAADATNEAEQNRLLEIRTGRIAADQATVILDADAALIVLREDGTAQAMTESLSQTRFDMVDVQERLGRGNVGTLTQEVEQTIIRSLEEMLDAIDAAKKESEKRQQQAESQQQNGGAMSEQDQRLIDILSELRMIRQMQIRVNDRTQRYEKMANEPNANLPELGKQVEELSRQQSRIAKILNTIKVGKNE
ncbi:MAG: hypothetical protein LBU65_05930, partial [Planctomycetaceae bacterium]|nr:hypothetical protein [Planctomycetaceae bacterium]